MIRNNFDLSLYLVTDRELSKGRDIRWVVEEAVKGGCTMVQLREKDCCTRDFLKIAQDLKDILRHYNVPLLINDRIDIALAVDADGVHIGQSDMPYDIARELLGPDKIIGLSVESIADVEAANLLDVDYIGVSPIFATATKTNTMAPFLLDGARRVAAMSKHPTVGIGGMNHTTAKDVIFSGLDGIAVVSDIVSADSPRQSAETLLKIVRDAQGRWSDNVWNVIRPIMERIQNLPFLQEMAAGTLPYEKFLRYLYQDDLYLINYCDEMSRLADMLPDSVMKELFRQFAKEGMEAEHIMHEQMIGDKAAENIRPMPGTTAYINHTRQYFEPEDLSMAMAAMLPCMWVYSEIGKYIISIEKDGDKNPYHEWISCYASDMMENGVRNALNLINEMAEKESPQRRAAMREAFVISTEMELRFWEQCY